MLPGLALVAAICLIFILIQENKDKSNLELTPEDKRSLKTIKRYTVWSIAIFAVLILINYAVDLPSIVKVVSWLAGVVLAASLLFMTAKRMFGSHS